MKVFGFKVLVRSLLISSTLSAISLAQTPQPNETPQLIESRELNSKVIKLFDDRKYDEALPLAKRALALGETALGPNHPDLISLLTNLGELYKAKLKLNEARSVFERAIKIGENNFGAEDLRVARILDRLAHVAFEAHEDRKSEELLARSLAIRQKTLGPEHPDLAQTAFDLGEIHRLRGEYSEAEPFYLQVIHIKEKTGKKDDPELRQVLESYLIILFAQKRNDEAARVQKRLAELGAQTGVVDGGVLNGRAVKLVQPSYPIMARSELASGMVRVRVLIDETGKVISAKAINPGNIHLALVVAAEDAARHSIFTPTFLSGVPVKVNGIIIYNFIRR
ncbi:MAG TPA: tetratricopeptide repeat protein [Pyrinomonadaceae bacterium]|nr:tetratricopeptide repeat protein [Pyrinomonadaceae bacterium]